MDIASGPLPLAMPLASWRRCSPPPPYHAETAADRGIAALGATVARRAARLRPALSRPPAHNPVARERLFTALTKAIGPGIPVQRHPARRHGALTAQALALSTPQGAMPWAPLGIGVDLLFVMAGKAVDQRRLGRPLIATHHACVRFVERSGQRAPEVLHAAVLEAAGHARAVLLAHLDGPLRHRLRSGTAPILLPAGKGAFLGHLRLHPTLAGGAPTPVMEAATWVHLCMLDTPQVEAREVLLAGLPAESLVRAVPEAWAGLHGSASGDRRVLAGLPIVPLAGVTSIADQLALASGPAMAAARLELGLACTDTLAAEIKAAR